MIEAKLCLADLADCNYAVLGKTGPFPDPICFHKITLLIIISIQLNMQLSSSNNNKLYLCQVTPNSTLLHHAYKRDFKLYCKAQPKLKVKFSLNGYIHN